MSAQKEMEAAAARVRDIAKAAEAIAQAFELNAQHWGLMDAQNAREGIRTRVMPSDLDFKLLEAARAVNGGAR